MKITCWHPDKPCEYRKDKHCALRESPKRKKIRSKEYCVWDVSINVKAGKDLLKAVDDAEKKFTKQHRGEAYKPFK